MITTAPTLTTTAADLADWLATHDHPELPPIVGIILDLHRPDGRIHVQLQLPPAGFNPVLDDLADWAEQIGTTVTLTSPSRRNIRASITTTLRNGQRVELWNYLDFPQLRALDAAGVALDDIDQVTVTSVALRTAERKGATR